MSTILEQNIGFLLIDKPTGISSHRVISILRRVTGIDRIGHAGTLDPFASGLLIVGVGREATRELDRFLHLPKVYEAVFVLGETTDTLDPDSPTQPGRLCTADDETIKKALKQFEGHLEQIPPMHSAIKVGGQKLYNLARQGIVIERKPRPVTISEFVLTGPIEREDGLVRLPVRIACSSGTYIRSLARDVATALQTVGYVEALRRMSIGPFSVESAQNATDLSEENWKTTFFKELPASIDEGRLA
ncbi:MAG: tRNA pseudouridine(55) synthase TruB [Patescibacteria group bacterium]|jgi:tRNA pseudouridine55 synthase